MDRGAWWAIMGYSPRARKQSDTTEQLHFYFLSEVLGAKTSTCEFGRDTIHSIAVIISSSGCTHRSVGTWELGECSAGHFPGLALSLAQLLPSTGQSVPVGHTSAPVQGLKPLKVVFLNQLS